MRTPKILAALLGAIGLSSDGTANSHGSNLLPATIAAMTMFASTAMAATTTTSTTVTFSVPASQQLPNPGTLLPASTHATLTALHASFSAPLTTANTFVFHNVTPGSYLADVHCATYGFAPLRVDVLTVEAGAGGVSAQRTARVRVWETFRGHDWDNKGEERVAVKNTVAAAAVESFPVKVLGQKVYYTERGSFSVLGILKNPMILMGLVSMALFVGLPKLVDNMDPEMRAEWEEQQKKNPMNSLMGGPSAGASPMGNFDVAGYLAGSKNNNVNSEGSMPASAGGGGGNGGGSKKSGKRG